jgi:hypothetical protein
VICSEANPAALPYESIRRPCIRLSPREVPAQNVAVFTGENGAYFVVRQPIALGDPGDRRFPELVESPKGSHPDVSLAILKQAGHEVVTKSVQVGQVVQPAIMQPVQTVPRSSDPEPVIPIHQQCLGVKLGPLCQRLKWRYASIPGFVLSSAFRRSAEGR